jgi:ribosome-associated protein
MHEPEPKPSKSARKRAAHALQDLGELLIELRAVDLAALNLPSELHSAVLEAKRINNSRGGMARQRQYIGKLMRQVDIEPIEAALKALGKYPAKP